MDGTMELKGRMKLIADKVNPCSIVCDIGTDHAYIPIYLVSRKVCNRAVASDVRKGPILIAEGNIAHYGLSDRIETRLGNGLDNIKKSEADVIIIAGMGGMLIKEILAQGFEKAKKANRLILQPMNAAEVVREWLYENGFEISDEELAQEGEKLYTVVVAKWTGKVRRADDTDFLIGEKLIERIDPLLHTYIIRKIKELEVMIDGLQKSSSGNEERMKKIDLKNQLEALLKKLE